MQAAKGKGQGLSFPMGTIPAGLLIMPSLLLLLSILFCLLAQMLPLLIIDLLCCCFSYSCLVSGLSFLVPPVSTLMLCLLCNVMFLFLLLNLLYPVSLQVTWCRAAWQSL